MDVQLYSSFTDSGLTGIGNIPSHWSQGPGFAYLREKKDKNFGLQERTVLSLSYGRIIVKPEDKLHGLVPESFETYQIVDPGDIIIRSTDLQNDKTSLRVGMVHNRGIITSAYMCMKTSGDLLPEYGYLLLHTLDITKVLYSFGSGLRQNLGYTDFKRLPLFAPPSDEQSAIVRFLKHANLRIEKAIRAKRKVIALLNEQKHVIIDRAVTRGLDSNVKLKPSNSRWFTELPEGWDALPLRRVITAAIDGPHFSPVYRDSGIPFLSARNVKVDRWSLEDAKYISEEDYKEFCKRVRPEIGDVLYTKGGTTGVARAVDLTCKFQVWVHIAVLKLVRTVIDPEYLAFALNSPRCYEQSQLFTRGATNQDLGLGRMKEIILPVPDTLEKQRSIVTHLKHELATFEAVIDRNQREIDLLREYRTRLIFDVVTGKLDVRQAAARLPDEVEALEDISDVEDADDNEGAE